MYDKQDPRTIQAMFGSIARGYDRANAILSFQMHKRWNAVLVSKVTSPHRPETLLDLCSGTGDIAYEYLKNETPPRQAYLLDFCPEMLECAKQKVHKYGLQRHSIHFVQGDAQDLPFPASNFNCATMAYGIRNIKDPLKSLQEVYRVLQPGGVLGILELTQPQNPVIRAGHKLYLKTLLPLLGRLVAKNQEAYRYLCHSIQAFVPPEQLEKLLKEAGFKEVRRTPLTFGIATILVATK
jgi:demethylmenaquinone methyltransferase/2-methoxy-6-polyprenyl-1,4-benzoquinol methylase